MPAVASKYMMLSPFIMPLRIVAPGLTAMGILSPVSAEASMLPSPSVTVPSTGTTSWGITASFAPAVTSSASIFLTVPSG